MVACTDTIRPRDIVLSEDTVDVIAELRDEREKLQGQLAVRGGTTIS